MKAWYDNIFKTYSVEEIVGNYDYHENFPYETQLLFFNGDIRKPIFGDFSSLNAFEIGCGEGRMIRRMSSFFKQVDGADIAQTMVSAAKTRCAGSDIFLTDGTGCGDANSSAYDFVYCTISLQHIASYDTRRSILNDIVRVLKPTGKVTLQLLFSSDFPYVPKGDARAEIGGALVKVLPRNTHNHASYFENREDAAGSNGACDCIIGASDINPVKDDFLTLFETCDLWFYDVSVGRDRQALSPIHPNSHGHPDNWQTHMIFVHCTKPRKSL